MRTDIGDKAFLGALIHRQSIIFSAGGEGGMKFAVTHFTTGPDRGSPVVQDPPGNKLIIVLIENNITGLTPSPVGPKARSDLRPSQRQRMGRCSAPGGAIGFLSKAPWATLEDRILVQAGGTYRGDAGHQGTAMTATIASAPSR